MDLKELKALLRLIHGTDVEELEVEEQGRRVRIRRAAPGRAGGGSGAGPAAPAPATTAANPAAPETAGLLRVEAPMVGTFYRAPAPDADAYVREGDVVQKGTVVCIIEAMKLMNEIESEVQGRLVKVLVENGQPVEYGQPLFLLDPR